MNTLLRITKRKKSDVSTIKQCAVFDSRRSRLTRWECCFRGLPSLTDLLVKGSPVVGCENVGMIDFGSGVEMTAGVCKLRFTILFLPKP